MSKVAHRHRGRSGGTKVPKRVKKLLAKRRAWRPKG
jgi:hypothetical protein